MILLRTASLLIISNIFMTFAWYGHLRNLSDRKWYVAVVISWVIALFEYMFMIPANRIGATELSLPQLRFFRKRYARRLRSICGALYETAAAARLSLGGALHRRRGV